KNGRQRACGVGGSPRLNPAIFGMRAFTGLTASWHGRRRSGFEHHVLKRLSESPVSVVRHGTMLERMDETPNATSGALPPRLHLSPGWSGPRKPFRHTWERVGNIDQFRWMVRRDVQEHLEIARDEL